LAHPVGTGAVLDQMGRHADAQRHYLTALKIAPDQPSVLSVGLQDRFAEAIRRWSSRPRAHRISGSLTRCQRTARRHGLASGHRHRDAGEQSGRRKQTEKLDFSPDGRTYGDHCQNRARCAGRSVAAGGLSNRTLTLNWWNAGLLRTTLLGLTPVPARNPHHVSGCDSRQRAFATPNASIPTFAHYPASSPHR